MEVVTVTGDRLGRVVYSKSGRDQGKMFVIVQEVNDRFVMLADGDLRKIDNPKLKNTSHIQFTKMKAEDVIEYLSRGEQPDNHVIRKNLKRLVESGESDGKEVW